MLSKTYAVLEEQMDEMHVQRFPHLDASAIESYVAKTVASLEAAAMRDMNLKKSAPAAERGASRATVRFLDCQLRSAVKVATALAKLTTHGVTQ